MELRNLGNTCFISGAYREDINRMNRDGTRGRYILFKNSKLMASFFIRVALPEGTNIKKVQLNLIKANTLQAKRCAPERGILLRVNILSEMMCKLNVKENYCF